MTMISRVISVFGIIFLSISGSAQSSDNFFYSSGVRIHYIVAGQGSPVILIHPFAQSAEIWTQVMTDLSKNFQVIALDCRGHGKSDKPHDPKQYGIEMVNDVVRLMDHLQMRTAIIIGYSMGGSIEMKMLTEHPDRFRLAVIGGSLGFSRDESEHDEVPQFGPDLLSGMPLSEAMIKNAPPNWPKPTAQQREMMKSMDAGQDPIALGAETVSHEGLWVTDEQLKLIAVPTLVIYGEQDRPSFYKAAQARFPNLKFQAIPGAGHSTALESQDFSSDIRSFIREHVGSGRN